MLKEQRKERAEMLLTTLNLVKASTRKVMGYSGGMVRQLNLIVALIHRGDVNENSTNCSIDKNGAGKYYSRPSLSLFDAPLSSSSYYYVWITFGDSEFGMNFNMMAPGLFAYAIIFIILTVAQSFSDMWEQGLL